MVFMHAGNCPIIFNAQKQIAAVCMSKSYDLFEYFTVCVLSPVALEFNCERFFFSEWF